MYVGRCVPLTLSTLQWPSVENNTHESVQAHKGRVLQQVVYSEMVILGEPGCLCREAPLDAGNLGSQNVCIVGRKCFQGHKAESCEQSSCSVVPNFFVELHCQFGRGVEETIESTKSGLPPIDHDTGRARLSERGVSRDRRFGIAEGV